MSYYDKPTYRQLKGCSVVVQHDNVDKALRKFKKKILESGLLNELREREFYEKPTAERKRKLAAAVKRHYKRLRSQVLPPKLY